MLWILKELSRFCQSDFVARYLEDNADVNE